MSDFIGWALERWPFAVIVIGLFALIFGGMAFGWGPDLIRPVSAQSVTQQIATAKQEVATQIAGVQQQVKSISDKQDAQDKRDHDDRVERLEQQLLWFRQQNCRSKGKARSDTWDTMAKLKDRYRDLTNRDWPMPTCSDIGE